MIAGTLSLSAHLAAAAAAIGAGLVNAIAGGGSLISFPVLTAIGVPTVHANATNTVSLCPGYIGGTHAQRRDLEGLRPSLRVQAAFAGVGGLLGSILLVVTSEAAFRAVVPYLILGACVLLAVQDRLRHRLQQSRTHGSEPSRVIELCGVFAASMYGGYFGAGLGIMLLAVLGLFSTLEFVRLNAVKQLLSLVINTCAAAFLVFSGKVEWSLVLVMAPGSLIGGQLGGRLATVIKPKLLRPFVLVFGFAVALIYLFR
jgi:uncharacterized membrane protein YfcA